MQEVHIGLWALLGAVVCRMALGGLWYSPALFIKPWMKMAGISEKQMNKGFAKAIVVDLIGALILAFVLAHAIKYAGADTLGKGLFVSFWNWLGFTATLQIGAVTYENKPMKMFWINSGYQFVSILAMGAVLTLWG